MSAVPGDETVGAPPGEETVVRAQDAPPAAAPSAEASPSSASFSPSPPSPPSPPAVRLEVRPDGVAVLTFDTPGSSVNTLSREMVDEVRAAADRIDADPAIRAVVLASAKPDNFIAGANIRELYATTDPAAAEALVRHGHALLDRLASSRKPVVAAIHGQALGGGLEVALACHLRIASDDPRTVLGLPEVTLGVLPAAGGTQRLPRLIGLVRALPMLLTGQRLRARRAKRAGLVDYLTSPRGIVETAARAALRLAEGALAPRKRKRALLDRLIGTSPGRSLVLRKARADVAKKTHGLYPAPSLVVDCVETGLARGFEAGREAEIRAFGRLTVGPEAKSLIWLFLAMQELKKPPAGEPAPRRVRRLAVVGGGFMGEGIASVSLPFAGSVVVKDVTPEALGRAAKGIHKGLARRQRSGALTRLERDRQWARLELTTAASAIRGADFVIEAVFETLDLKRRVLAECEAVLAPDAVFATNTSAIPVTLIAAGAAHPERVIGMHYFSPVHKMPLLEVVVTPRTADWAVATARAFGTAQGKTVIVVKDGPGFYTTRILAPYMNEAMVLLEEGAEIEDLDLALMRFGFPVGPCALLDEVGIDVGADVGRDLGAAFAHRGTRVSPLLSRLFEAGYHGRKNGRGLYRYAPRGKKVPNHDVYPFTGRPSRRTIPAEEMAERLAWLLINEAAWCLAEGVVASARDADVGAVLGLGFPPFRGGPFHHVDAVGAASVVERLRTLAGRHGQRFEPAPLLVEVAEKGQRFFAPPGATG